MSKNTKYLTKEDKDFLLDVHSCHEQCSVCHPEEELDQWEDDGGPTWPVYEEAKGG